MTEWLSRREKASSLNMLYYRESIYLGSRGRKQGLKPSKRKKKEKRTKAK